MADGSCSTNVVCNVCRGRSELQRFKLKVRSANGMQATCVSHCLGSAVALTSDLLYGVTGLLQPAIIGSVPTLWVKVHDTDMAPTCADMSHEMSRDRTAWHSMAQHGTAWHSMS